MNALLPNNQPVLLVQANKRLVVVLLLFMAMMGGLTWWFQESSARHIADSDMDLLTRFYHQRLQRLEREWQGEAVHFKERMAYDRILEKGKQRWLNFKSYLTTFAGMGEAAAIVITDRQDAILFSHVDIPALHQGVFPEAGKSGWYWDAGREIWYRYFSQPLFLSQQEGMGWLILLKPVDSALLFNNAFPHTDLFLVQDGAGLASSLGPHPQRRPQVRDGPFWFEGIRYQQASLPWQVEDAQSPRLVIQHRVVANTTWPEMLAMWSLGLTVLGSLLYLTLGSWFWNITRRVVRLGLAAREFTRQQRVTPEMELHIQEIVAAGDDEVATVANSLVALTTAVVQREEARQQKEDQLRESETRFRAMTHSLLDAILVFDEQGLIRFINQSGLALFGWPEESLLGQPIALLFPGPLPWVDGMPEVTLETTAIRHNRQELPVEIAITSWFGQGQTHYAIAMRDITQRREMEERDLRAYASRLAISALMEVSLESLPLQAKLDRALDIILTIPWLAIHSKGAIFLVTGENTLTMAVQRGLHPALMPACQVIPFGFCLCGQAAASRQLVFASHVDTRHVIEYNGMTPHGHYCVPILFQHDLLGVLNLYVEHGHPFLPEEEAMFATMANTLAGLIERSRVNEQIEHMASHDQLTGLPNRSLFQEHMEQELRHAVRNKGTLAVAFLDLDHFKEVNDTLGHEAGDQLLKIVTQRLKSCLRDSDTLARLGGDEFTLILPAVGHQAHAALVADKIVQVLQEPILIHQVSCQIGVSVGLSLYPQHGDRAELLLQRADQAMYAVKSRGRNSYLFWDEGCTGSS